ncbi:Coenzyme Q-binding protein coq10a, mitochondrial [Mortierella alpina]|nr:Coenzyme Q-binding protein coq10a, mitochondrial [Mortierella alpina]
MPAAAARDCPQRITDPAVGNRTRDLLYICQGRTGTTDITSWPCEDKQGEQERGWPEQPELGDRIPTIPNLLKPLSISASRHYKDRTLLKYSQQEFYDLVANVDDYHKFLPWCTYSKMSAPVRSKAANNSTQPEQVLESASGPKHGEITTRHGELGIGFNSLQERYMSTVTCQEPWMVRAVSYDSKLFKELSTTWKFTPNVPKTTTLEATMDQEVQEHQLLFKRTDEAERGDGQDLGGVTPHAQKASVNATTPCVQESTISQPVDFSTAASVFGSAAVPRFRDTITKSSIKSTESISTQPSTLTTEQLRRIEQQHPPRPLPPAPKQTILRTASRSNLATMNPSDFPSVWVDFEIQFEFASPVHATMSSLFFDQVSREMLAAFVKRAEVLYGKR